MKIYVPSWNGDFRLESHPTGSKLILHQPTPHELKLVGTFLHEAFKKKWTGIGGEDVPYSGGETEIVIKAPLAKTSKALIKVTRPKKQTLTAVSFSDGKLSVIEGATSEALEKIEKEVERAATTEKKEKPAAAASVKRPTPCCPDCLPGAIGPASEVLLSFLSPEQHETWRQQRALVAEGQLTGHRYLITHRHSVLGQRIGRVCYDLDDDRVVHFHDSSVPPEEEVLAAKLILEHKEPWLRNEATCFGGMTEVFKNPFGGISDGVESAEFSRRFGDMVMSLMSPGQRAETARDYSNVLGAISNNGISIGDNN